MQAEAEEWITEAEDNLSTAKLLYENGKFKDSAYYCHQTMEKALKAVQIDKLKKFEMIHDLTRLAKSVGAPHDIILNCEKITKYYIPTKYPIAKREIPTEEELSKTLDKVEEVLEWARSILK